MAVIVALSDTTLSTSNGFTRTLGDNLGTFSTTQLSLSSTRSIAFTPSYAEDMKGVAICLTSGSTQNNFKDVTVELVESGSTVRASKTLTTAQICNSSAYTVGFWWIYFEFTSPYTVDTTPSKWTIRISNATGTQNWDLRTSDGTNIAYIAVGSTAVSYTDNTDQPIAIGKITFDQNATLKGKLGTGDSTRSVCAIACRHTNTSPDNIHRFEWGTSGSYTITLDGLMVLGAHSGFRAGTIGSPITRANAGVLHFASATSGTATNTGITHPGHTATARSGRNSIFIYSEVPPNATFAKLGANTSTGVTSITTDVTTGWVNGDRIVIGGGNTKGMGDRTVYTVSSSSGTTVNFSPSLTGMNRTSGGHIIKLGDYGFTLSAYSTFNNITTAFSNINIDGLYVKNIVWIDQVSSVEDLANIMPNQKSVKNVSVELFTTNTAGNPQAFGWYNGKYTPTVYQNIYTYNTTPCNCSGTGDEYPIVSISDCIGVILGPINGSIMNLTSYHKGTLHNCVFEHSNNMMVQAGGFTSISKCKFWSNSSGNGGIRYNSAIENSGGENEFDNMNTGVEFVLATGTSKGDKFGQRTANTNDVVIVAGCFANFSLINPVGNVTFSGTSTPLNNTGTHGFNIKISGYNTTANDDRCYLKYGYYQKTGTGLADTTCRTSGGFAHRLRSTSATNVLPYPNLVSERVVPTGNIQNKPMTIGVWMKINNGAYYGGTHIMPKLYVKYDDTTIVSATATQTTNWQFVSVSFTPTTTFGQVETWVETATDAYTPTLSNADVYLDDFSILYPAGVTLDLGTLDLSANGTPVWPPIATSATPQDIWAVDPTTFGANTVGDKINVIDINADDAVAIGLTK